MNQKIQSEVHSFTIFKIVKRYDEFDLISASGPKEVLSLLSTSKYNFYMMIKNLPISNIMQIVFNIISQKDTCVFQTVHHLFI